MRPDEVPKGESRRHRYWEDNKEASLAGAKFLGVQETEKGLATERKAGYRCPDEEFKCSSTGHG